MTNKSDNLGDLLAAHHKARYEEMDAKSARLDAEWRMKMLCVDKEYFQYLKLDWAALNRKVNQ